MGSGSNEVDELRRQVDESRENLGEAVGALAYKADVKNRGQEAISDKKEAVMEKIDELKSKVTGDGDGDGIAGTVKGKLPDGEAIKLSLGYATPFTVILVASSFTCQWGVFAAEKGDVFKLRRWFVLTFIMGLLFVLGQANEYRMQVDDGNTISATGYGSVFYLTTGFHGLHVIGGLVAFILFLARTTLGKFTPAQATAAIVVSYYWHFVDVVWIGLFAVIYIIR